MFANYSILIAEDFIGQYSSLSKCLNEYGIPVLYCKNNSLDIRVNVLNNYPTIIVFNSSLYNFDMIKEIINAVKDRNYSPVIYNIYTYEDYERLMLLNDNCMSYNVPTPYNVSAIAGHLKLICENIPINENKFKEIIHCMASEILREFCISPLRTGFDYIVDAIMHILFSHRKKLIDFKNTVYLPISQKRQVTEASVERAMRIIIGKAWQRSSKETKLKYFSENGLTEKCPSNSDFVLQIADYIYNKDREYFDKYYSIKGY